MIKLKMKPLDWAAYVLVTLGALNWGLDKVLNFNVVDKLLSLVGATSFAIYVYGLVGLAGVYSVVKIFK